MEEGQIAFCQLVKARENPTEMLDFVEETLNQMPFFVEVAIILTWGFAV